MLPKFSVRKPYTVLVGVVVILVLGYLSFTNMSMDFLPNMEFPYAIVMTTYPGASPEEVELSVTTPVEAAMARIGGVKEIQSVSNQNLSIVIMEFNDGTDMNGATIDMRESLDQIEGYWDDTISSPTIMKINPDSLPVMVAAIDYDDIDSVEASRRAESDIIPELESVEGVASVTSTGQVTERVDVTLSDSKIEAMNKKVSDALDGKFSDAEEKIDKGQKKIEKGKKTLDEKKDEAAEKMAEGQGELNKATGQIDEGLKEINTQIAAIKEQKKTLKTNEKELQTAKATLLAQKKNVEATITTLENMKSALETAKKGLEELDKKISALKSQISAGGSDTAELEGQLAALIALRKSTVEELAKYGVSEDEIDDKIAELTEGLTQAKSGLSEIEKQLSEIEKGQKQIKTAKKKISKGLKKLESMKKKLESGQITTQKALKELNKQQILAGIEMSVAQSSLNSGEEKLKTAKEEFKNTKKTTKENTDLNKILTKEMLENILKAENFDMPAGYVDENGEEYLVRVGDKLTSDEDVRDLVLLDLDIDGLDPIKLSDIADVKVTDDSDDVYTVVNGNPAVAVTMQKQSGFSTGDVTDSILKKMETLESEYEGVHISVLMNQGVYIDLVVKAVIQNLIFGGILAILILLLFLRDIRPTIIVACSIPLSLVAAIVAMYFSGVTLNIISLSGLALGVGMLVDNSVVVIENIYRMRDEGVSFRRAAILGAKQVGGAIISSTLTTVCVFAPIVFTEGITKQLFTDLGLTLTYTLAASLIIAMTLVPAMSAGLLKREGNKKSKILTAITNGYARILRPILRFKWIVILVSVICLGLFAFLATSRGTSMFPDMQSTQITITMTCEDDVDMEGLKERSDAAIEKMLEISDIETIGAINGSTSYMSSMSGGSSSSLTMYAITSEDRQYNSEEIKDQILEKTKDIDATFDVNTSAMDMSVLTGEGVRMYVKGRNLDKLRTISEDVVEALSDIEGLTDISNGLEESGEEYRITVDKAKAMKYSLTVAGVYAKIREKVAESSKATTLSTDIKDYQLYVKSDSDESITRDDLEAMKIDYTDPTTNKSKTVKLKKIATFETVSSPNSVRRRAQTRYVQVSAKIDDGYIVDNIAKEVKEKIDTITLPEGYEIEYDGESEATAEAVGQVLLMLVLAVILMYLIMVAQFQGLLSPFIILFTIPLAFTGGFIGLYLSGSDVSVIALVGFVMLSGIIVNNGIVLVDYTNQLRITGEGMDKREAIIEAGSTRLRPILMTAITTILGLVPMVVSHDLGSDMTRPMAIVVIGGLTYGTLLTLFVVPCMYDVFSRKHMRSMAEIEAMEEEVLDT